MKGIWKIVIIENIIIDYLLCPAVHEAFCKTQEWQPLLESIISVVIEVESMMSPGQDDTKYKVLLYGDLNDLLSQGTTL